MIATRPLESFTRDVGRDLVIAVEFTKRNFVAEGLQPRSDAAAATVDRKNVIVCAV